MGCKLKVSPRRALFAVTLASVAVSLAAPPVHAADPAGQIAPVATGGATSGFTANLRPAGIAVGADGNVWFTLPFTGIGRVNSGGSVSIFTSGITSDSIQHITAGPDGNLWFTEFNSPEKIGKVTTAGVITEVATAGVTPGLPQGNIEDITSGPDGNLWFTMPFVSGGHGAVGKIDPATNTVTVYSATYAASTQPRGITAGPDGNVWFTDSAADTVVKIAPASGTMTVVATGGTTPGFSTNTGLGAITTGPDGSLWVLETGSVARVTTAGSVAEFTLEAGSYEYSIASACDGNLWVTQNPDGAGPAKIWRVTTSGGTTAFTQGLPSGSIPNSITAVAGGDVYFADGADPGHIMSVGTGCAAQAPTASPVVVLTPQFTG